MKVLAMLTKFQVKQVYDTLKELHNRNTGQVKTASPMLMANTVECLRFLSNEVEANSKDTYGE